MPRRILHATRILAITLLVVAPAAAQPAPLAGFDAAVAKAVQDWRVPGLAVAVVKDGEVVFSKGYGVRELGKPGRWTTTRCSRLARRPKR